MRAINSQFLETPWYGSRQMVRHLRRQGQETGRTRVRRIMACMGLAAIYQRPKTTVRHPQHRVFPHAKDNPGAMRASAARVHDALGWMEQALSTALYLAGDDITAADIVALRNIQMLRRVAVRPESIEMALGLEDLGAPLPALGAWLSRMEKMRGYDAA